MLSLILLGVIINLFIILLLKLIVFVVIFLLLFIIFINFLDISSISYLRLLSFLFYGIQTTLISHLFLQITEKSIQFILQLTIFLPYIILIIFPLIILIKNLSHKSLFPLFLPNFLQINPLFLNLLQFPISPNPLQLVFPALQTFLHQNKIIEIF